MFIAQIKTPIRHSSSCGWSGSLSAALQLISKAACKVKHYLKHQARLQGEKPSFPMHTDATKACCIKAGKHLGEITSGAGGLQRKHAQQHWKRMIKC